MLRHGPHHRQPGGMGEHEYVVGVVAMRLTCFSAVVHFWVSGWLGEKKKLCLPITARLRELTDYIVSARSSTTRTCTTPDKIADDQMMVECVYECAVSSSSALGTRMFSCVVKGRGGSITALGTFKRSQNIPSYCRCSCALSWKYIANVRTGGCGGMLALRIRVLYVYVSTKVVIKMLFYDDAIQDPI